MQIISSFQPDSQQIETGLLHIVATPIGNLADMSARACEVLGSVGVIACEDTRVSGNLLRHYGIKTPLIPYHEHNAEKQRPALLARLAAGEDIALISDAGTPLISDPGHKLVSEARMAGIRVSPVPGASAVITALSVCGLPVEPFSFLGFLPHKTGAKKEVLSRWAAVPSSLAFYESPNRIEATLGAAYEVLGDREAALARELTKQFETIATGSLAEFASEYAQHDVVKGEYVVMIGPPKSSSEGLSVTQMEADIKAALAEGRGAKEIAVEFSALTGKPKRELYQFVLSLK